LKYIDFLLNCSIEDGSGTKVPPQLIRVYVGEIGRGLGKPYDVLYTVVHEKFNYYTKSNDIAILKLSEPLTYSENIQPTEFVPANFVLPGGSMYIISVGNHKDSYYYDVFCFFFAAKCVASGYAPTDRSVSYATYMNLCGEFLL